MPFRSIDHLFKNVTLVNTEDSDCFCPAAIDPDPVIARHKARMEGLESQIDAAEPLIATAAHVEKDIAIYNAQKEAIERLSLAPWWAFRRPVLSKLGENLTKSLCEYHLPEDDSFHADIGFVEPVCGTGFLAVSILQNHSEFPYAVLGGKYSDSYEEAAHGAFLESLQSWAATDWLRHNNVEQMPYWDSVELFNRSASIAAAPELTEGRPFDSTMFNDFFSGVKILLQSHDEYYIAGVDIGESASGRSYDIAELDRKPGEEPLVFTQCNY